MSIIVQPRTTQCIIRGQILNIFPQDSETHTFYSQYFVNDAFSYQGHACYFAR